MLIPLVKGTDWAVDTNKSESAVIVQIAENEDRLLLNLGRGKGVDNQPTSNASALDVRPHGNWREVKSDDFAPVKSPGKTDMTRDSTLIAHNPLVHRLPAGTKTADQVRLPSARSEGGIQESSDLGIIAGRNGSHVLPNVRDEPRQ